MEIKQKQLADECAVNRPERWLMSHPKQVMAGTLATITFGLLLSGFTAFRDQRSFEQPAPDNRPSVGAAVTSKSVVTASENRLAQSISPITLAASK
jgi:hypothetical protein